MRAAIYARVSTQRQAQSQSIDQQLTRLQQYVHDHGWLLEEEHIYRDDGHSGSKLARPGLDSLRDRAMLCEFDIVVITTPDRLARNYVHQMVIIEELSKRQIQMEFLDRPMSDDPHDRLLLQIRGAVAEYERTLIAERMRRGRLMKYKNGDLLPWTRVLYGYQTDPQKPRAASGVRIDPAQAAIVQQIFAWYLEPGMTLYGLVKRLLALNVASPGGKDRWNTSTIRNMLRNPAYTGMAYANRARTEPAKRRRSALQSSSARGETQVARPHEDWIGITVPTIVDAAVFEQVQEKLQLNKQTASRNNKAHQYLLRGLVSCGSCRLSAHGRTQNQIYHYYVCRRRTDALRAVPAERCTSRFMPATQLDELVWQDLCRVLTQPDIIEQALRRAHGGEWLPQELRSRIQHLHDTLKQLERQQKRLLDAYLADILELPEFERKQQELRRQQHALSIQQQQLKQTAHEQLELGSVAASLTSFCTLIQPTLQRADFAQKRQLIELLIDRVVVTDEEVEIRYAIPTSPEGTFVPFSHLCTHYRKWLS